MSNTVIYPAGMAPAELTEMFYKHCPAAKILAGYFESPFSVTTYGGTLGTDRAIIEHAPKHVEMKIQAIARHMNSNLFAATGPYKVKCEKGHGAGVVCLTASEDFMPFDDRGARFTERGTHFLINPDTARIRISPPMFIHDDSDPIVYKVHMYGYVFSG